MLGHVLFPVVCLSAAFATSQCPTGFQEAGDGSCYKAFPTALSFEKAAEVCQTHGGFLASVTNGFANSFLRGLTLNLTSAWIGLYCHPFPDYCDWQNGDNLFYTNLQYSCSTYETEEACLFIQPSGYWCHSNCSVAKPYICQVPDLAASPCYGWRKPPFNDNCYKTFNQTATEAAAEQICQQNCGHLAYISSPSDNAIVSNLLCKECHSSPLFTRIGLINNGDYNYTWTNGNALDPTKDFSNFGIVLPSLGNCVNMALRNTTDLQKGQWINADCNEKTAFTCYRAQGKCAPSDFMKTVGKEELFGYLN